MGMTTSILGKKLEDTVFSFRIGESFNGFENLIGASYVGVASWDVLSASTAPVLLIERRFATGDQEVLLRERYSLDSSDQLVVESSLKGMGDRSIKLYTEEDLARLIKGLDASGDRLVRDVDIRGEITPRGGLLIDAPAAGVGALVVPCSVTLRYDDVACKMTYARYGPAPERSSSSPETRETARSQPGDAVASSRPSGLTKRVLSVVSIVLLKTAVFSLRVLGKACKAGCRACAPATSHPAGRPGRCDANSLAKEGCATLPLVFDRGAGVGSLLDPSEQALSARDGRSALDSVRHETQISCADSLSTGGDREVALLQMLGQQQRIQQELMQKMLQQQALIPQTIQSQQAFVEQHLSTVQQRLDAHSSLQQRFVERQFDLDTSPSRPSEVESLRSFALSGTQTPLVYDRTGDQDARRQHREIKDALLKALDQSVPSSGRHTPRTPLTRSSLPTTLARFGTNLAARIEDTPSETASIRSVRDSMLALQRVRERLDASTPSSTTSSALMTPKPCGRDTRDR